MRVSANLTMLFNEVPLLQRYEKAARAGFRLVEVSLPYSETAEALRDEADKHNLQHTLINAPTGDWSAGARGLAAIIEHEQFKASIDTAVHYANTLKCPRVHIMAGIADSSSAAAEQLFLTNVRYAAKRLSEHSLDCLIEPICPAAIPNYFLNSYAAAERALSEIAAPNLQIQYDLFHAEQMGDDREAVFERIKNHIGYIQVAQVPRRGSPATAGTLDFRRVFAQLSSLNDNFVVGCEYLMNEDKQFDWVRQLGLEF